MANEHHQQRKVTRLHTDEHPAPGTPFDVPAEQLERIVARASALQHAAGYSENRGLSEEEVIAIAREVGLDSRHVRRAIAEYRADSLAPKTTDLFPLLTRLVGPPWVRARRVIDGTPEQVHGLVAQRLREHEHLRSTRMRGTRSIWEADTGWARKLQRALDFEGRGYELSKLGALEVVTAPVSPDASLLTLTLDTSEVRSEHAAGWGLGVGIPALVGGYALLGLGTIPVTVLALAAATMLCRWTLAARRQRMSLVLEGLLDQVEAAH